jgi:adenine-specific DNA-methyltransferase
VYADPPYTKDHYSRYYHVYETLYRYDYPDSVGQGRYRADRQPSQFSIMSTAVGAFEDLFDAVAARGLPLVLSYPENGLATHRVDLVRLLERYFTVETVLEVPLDHSTLGGSKGPTTKAARERIYVCRS